MGLADRVPASCPEPSTERDPAVVAAGSLPGPTGAIEALIARADGTVRGNGRLAVELRVPTWVGRGFTVARKPLHFSTNGRTFFVADSKAGEAQPFHSYVRRHEPVIVFGSSDSGVANSNRDDGVGSLTRRAKT